MLSCSNQVRCERRGLPLAFHVVVTTAGGRAIYCQCELRQTHACTTTHTWPFCLASGVTVMTETTWPVQSRGSSAIFKGNNCYLYVTFHREATLLAFVKPGQWNGQIYVVPQVQLIFLAKSVLNTHNCPIQSFNNCFMWQILASWPAVWHKKQVYDLLFLFSRLFLSQPFFRLSAYFTGRLFEGSVAFGTCEF